MGLAEFAPVARGFYLEALLVDGEDVWFTDVALGGVRRLGSDQVLLEDRTRSAGSRWRVLRSSSTPRRQIA